MSNDKPVVGVDLGGTKILSAVIEADGNILSRAKMRSKPAGGPDHVIARIARSIADAIERAGVSGDDIQVIGVGSPGPLDPEEGIIIETHNLGWCNVPLAAQLEKLTGIRTIVENDVDVGTLGEFVYGAARGANTAVGVFVGTGIGGGVIVDGKLLRGSAGVAAEIGHTVVRHNGAACNCGARGCMEAYAGRWAIAKRIDRLISQGRSSIVADIVKKNHAKLTGRKLEKAWKAGDEVVRETLERACMYLGTGIGSVVNLLSPDVIIMGGGVFEALGEELLPITIEQVERTALEACLRKVRIVLAALGDDAVVLGASVAARRRILS